MKINTGSGGYDTNNGVSLREAVFWVVHSDYYEKSDVLNNPVGHLLSKSYGLAQRVSDHNSHIENFKENIRSNLVPIDQLNWIRKLKMEEALYLYNLFCLLNNSNQSFLHLNPNEYVNVDNNIFQIPPYTIPTLGHLIEVLTFNFDCALFAQTSLKVKILERFQSLLLQSKENAKSFLSFINNEFKDNNDFEEWIFNYLIKNNFPYDMPLNNYFLPRYRNLDALKVVIRAASDSPQNEYYLKHTLSTIKSAWSQKKHRDSKNGRKACSFQLSERHIELLNDLTELKRRRKNEMLEILIEDACKDAGIIKKPARR